jgi:multiple sugar transport system permease protein
MTILLLAGLQAIPQELYAQARIDGAGALRRFFTITLPLIKPVLFIALIFRTIDSLRIFDLVYVLTGGGPGGSTRTLSLLGFEYFSNDRFGMGSAVSVMTFVLAFLFTFLYIRGGGFSRQLRESES